MGKAKRWLFVASMASLMVAVCGCEKPEESTAEATQLMEEAYKAKDYSRLMALADSLEKIGELLPASANYWRGYACDRQKQKDEAAFYWRTSITDAEKSESKENLDAYVKSASRLANQLSLGGDYDGTLQMALPVVSRLETLKCDTTSDYVNLLIYIGLCQVSTGQSEEDSKIGFYRACKKHRENIEKNHSDNAYKDAIAGLVNIAYYCVKAERYEQALYYTSNFGDLLIEYEQRPGVDENYVDRQVGRYTIYKALALDRLGRKKDAADTFDAFRKTNYSQTKEGMTMAEEYQKNGTIEEELTD